MQHPESPVSRGDLLAWLADQGCSVTEHQLVRWHKHGLIPSPTRKFLGRARGSESFYPAGTGRQALRLAEALRADRSAANAAWTLWLDGFPVTRVIRRRLREEFEGIAAYAAAQLEAFESETSCDNVIDMAASLPAGRAVERLRSAVGNRDFPFIVRAMLESMAGRSEAILAEGEVERDALLNAINSWMAGVPNPSAIRAESLLTYAQQHSQEYSPLAFVRALDATDDAQLEMLLGQILSIWRVAQAFQRSASQLPYSLFAFGFIVRLGCAPTREFIETLIADARINLPEVLQEFIRTRPGIGNDLVRNPSDSIIEAT